jgi:Zn-dependent protease with chaperone function
MHEYPLAIYFAAFVLLIWYSGDLSLMFFTVFAFLSGLYAHKLFSLLGFERYDFEEYPYVYVVPMPFKSAFTVGNAIVISRRLVEEVDEDVLRAIIYHELGHVKFRDFTTVFLLVFVYSVIATYSRSKVVLFAYLLLFVWIYWHMEARADMYALRKSANIEKALEQFNLKWRLAFLRGDTNTQQQTAWVLLTILFFAGFYLGTLFMKGQ